ncbi:MAG: MFS transporter [Candidatus Limnocylindrales bacterium]
MGRPRADTISSARSHPTGALSRRELFDLSAYWLAINLLWGALGISLLPLLMVQLVCGGSATCAHPVPILGSFAPGKGVAEALIVNAGLLVAILVQPTAAAISDAAATRWGRRKPFILAGTLLDVLFLLGLYLVHTWIGVFACYVLLQFSSNLAQGPFQGYLPDLVPACQVGLAGGLMGLMIMLGQGGGPMLVALANGLGNPRLVVVPIMAVELGAAALTLWRVREGPVGMPREGRSFWQIARRTWSTDILAERSYVWLLASRLFLLMGGGTVTAVGFFYMQDAFGLDQAAALGDTFLAGALVVGFGALATLPAGRLSQRVGRKRTITAAATLGLLGMACVALAPAVNLALAAIVPIGMGVGAFLAVDWALLADIVPKAASGRYMGLSNVVTAGSGALAAAVGLGLVDAGNAAFGFGAGPRLAFAAGAIDFLVGALLLTRVVERRRQPEPARLVEPAAEPA